MMVETNTYFLLFLVRSTYVEARKRQGDKEKIDQQWEEDVVVFPKYLYREDIYRINGKTERERERKERKEKSSGISIRTT